ncbi:uncharacterized protein LOC118646965 [Monomorium pharaonis]|uniref:uncharacterized protein LOC118646965 n=1 Tax=Monomorium pharaonis TaxID=307658 RepID=UPI00174770EE|nr:uncharacterized protein LOC118646965 [Monomorium pharaonis]
MKKIFVPVDDIPSIEHTLRPISYISWLLGVGVARPRKFSKTMTIIIRIVHLVMCSVSMVCNAIDLFNYVSINKLYNHMFLITYFMDRMMCYVSAYYYIYHGIRQYDKWSKLIDKIKGLDQKIRKETQINDQPIRNVEVIAILATTVCCLLLLIIPVVRYCIDSRNIYATELLLFYVLAQSLVNSFVFDVVVYVLYYRFQTINKLIGQLDKLFNASWAALKIKRMRELHYDICDLVIMINEIHGLQLLLCSANCFTAVEATLFRIYLLVLKEPYNYCYYILINSIVCILYLVQFGLMCWICTLARQESDKTGIIICAIILKRKPVNHEKLHETINQTFLEVQNSNWSSNHNWNYVVIENFFLKNLEENCVRNEINDFSIQLQLRRVAFTACYFFEISNNLFCGVSTKFIYFITIHVKLAIFKLAM